MVRGGMNRRRIAGASLIEVLVVIVVFLVGILAVVQIFPPGLGVLRQNRAQIQAISMARAEVQRALGQSAQLPERIVAATFDASGAVYILGGNDPNEMNPPVDPVSGNGEINAAGQVIVSGNPIGHWTKLTGPNRITRVIGEGKPISQPNIVNGVYGSRMQLLFGPIFYQYDAGNNRSLGQVLSVYGNDLRLESGASDNKIPDPAQALYDTDEFFFVPARRATLTANTPVGFDRKDQLWVPRLQDTGTNTLLSHAYRVSMSFVYNDGTTDRIVQGIFTAYPDTSNAYYREFANYAVISLPDLLAGSMFNPAGYRGVEYSTLRLARVFREVPTATAFSPYDPYEFKPWNHALGTLLLNPAGAQTVVRDLDGNETPLMAKVDYSVYDWRIIRDEFQVPSPAVANTYNPTVKLLANQIVPGSGTGPDNKPYGGIALAGDSFLFTPNATGATGSQDFVLLDLATGGVVAGNTSPGQPGCYFVDKSNGTVQFRDTDGTDAFAITGRIWLPNGNYGGWTDSGPMELAGRKVQALYMATGEYAVQMLKASSSYGIVYPTNPNQLVAGQTYQGGSNGWGQPNRLYFPLIDSGQKVTIREAWISGPDGPVIRSRAYKIAGIEAIGGVTLAYVQLPAGDVFDSSRNGYAVRGVEGASIKVRSFYNPQRFQIVVDTAQNFENITRWTQFYRLTSTETFDAGGNY